MGTLTPALRQEGKRIHFEHQALEEVLNELNSALDQMACHGDVVADFRAAGQLRRCGRQLIESLPEHCRREEAVLLEPVSEVSPELAEFCTRMKDQHTDLLLRLHAFRDALDDFNRADDLSEAISKLNKQGRELTRELRHHVATEEQELSGFL